MPIFDLIAVTVFMGSGLFFLARSRFSAAEFMQTALILCFCAVHILDVLALGQPSAFFEWKRYGLVAEALIPLTTSLVPLWLFHTKKLKWPTGPQALVILFSFVFIPLVWFNPTYTFVFNPDVVDEQVLFVSSRGFWFYLGIVFYLVYGIYHLEQGLLKLNRQEFWQAKYAILGLGVVIAIMAFYYSQSVIHRSLDLSLMPLRAGAMLGGSCLLFYSRAWRGDVRKIMFSRTVAFRSLVFLSVGLYLMGMAVFGDGFQFLQGTDGRMWSHILIVGGLFLFAIILMAESVRRRIKVFLHKHFYRNKYEYRTQWMEFTQRLNSAVNERELYVSIVEFFCETFGLRGGVIFQKNNEGRFEYRYDFGGGIGSVPYELPPGDAAMWYLNT